MSIGAASSDVLILNVNDDEPNRYAVTRMLKRANYRVIEADCGEQALKLVSEQQPTLVVLDVRLPDMSGFEVCRRIKQRSNTVVLHVSALAVDSRDRVTGLEGGADGYLSWPVEPNVLLATVGSLLRMHDAETRARASSEHWQACFDAVRDGIALIGDEGRVVRCNDAFTAIFQQQMKDEPLFGEGGLLPVIKSSAEHRLELERDERWFQVSVDPLRTGGGAVLVMVDVTERKLLEQALTSRAQELVEGDRRKDEFLAMLAHELRNPLSAVTSALELLPDAPSSQRVAAVIRRQTFHVARLIEDLLDVSRIRRGRIELKRATLELPELLTAVVDGIRPRARLSGHTLTLRLPEEPVCVHGDATRLEQVIANLLDNACRYTGSGGRIDVELQRTADRAVIQVRDSGDGIPEPMLDKVFDLFTQLNVTIDRKRGGLGIGLTLVKNLVEMHGGSVRAQSEGPGRGSTFTVELPTCMPAPVQPLVPLPAVDAASASPRGLKILVVEDNEDAREMLKDLLVVWGHDVVTEADGRAGLARGLREHFDAAIVDIGLPLLDGYALARQLKATQQERTPFLIALTGYGSADEKGRSAQAGFSLHMVKPVDVDLLSRVLGELQEHPRLDTAATAPESRA